MSVEEINTVYALQLDQPYLKCFMPARMPSDERLFMHGMGGLTSFMASSGIEDFGEWFGEYPAQATEFHRNKGEPFKSYVVRKVSEQSNNLSLNTIREIPAPSIYRHRVCTMAAIGCDCLAAVPWHDSE